MAFAAWQVGGSHEARRQKFAAPALQTAAGDRAQGLEPSNPAPCCLEDENDVQRESTIARASARATSMRCSHGWGYRVKPKPTRKMATTTTKTRKGRSMGSRLSMLRATLH